MDDEIELFWLGTIPVDEELLTAMGVGDNVWIGCAEEDLSLGMSKVRDLAIQVRNETPEREYTVTEDIDGMRIARVR